LTTSGLWNIDRPQPWALPSGSGQLYFIISRCHGITITYIIYLQFPFVTPNSVSLACQLQLYTGSQWSTFDFSDNPLKN